MILRVCVCIPSYNNPLTIAAVIDDALTMTDFPVLVIDDGSSHPVRDLLSASARTNSRLTILRHEVNQGKGRALQLAIRHAVDKGFTHLMAVDGDGQHHVSEIAKLVAMAKEDPWALIIGNRKLKSASVPGISKFGRNFSNFWVQFQTGTAIADSQSGFRLYPLFFCQNMKFWTKRYDFEIEVLIRLMWKNVRVRETEIEVFYPEKDQRVSHFDKLWDNVRISCLNIVFVIVSLLKTHRSPKEVSKAVGAGVFIGCTPFFGLHTAIVAAVSFFFRLNAGFLWLGSQVSIPPLAPFLVIGSIAIGRWITKLWLPAVAPITISAEHHGIRDLIEFGSKQILEWFIGSAILGTVLGISAAAVTYVIARKLHGTKKLKANWSGQTRGGKFGNGFLKLVLKNLDIRVGYFVLCFIVPYFYLFAPKGRRSLNEYWKIIAPEKSWAARQFAIIRHFYKFGQVLMDRLAQSFRAHSLFTSNPHGIESVLESLASGKSILFIGAHVGGWDLAASLLKESGFKTEMHIVEYRATENRHNFAASAAGSPHVKSLDSNRTEQPVFDIHQLLSEGKPIGLMGDRPLANRFELVSFFGKLAPFDTTAFRVAAAARVPLIMTFGFKAHGRTYDFFSLPARQYAYDPKVDRAIQCREWVQEFATELSLLLKRYPDQWFNFFEFWSSLPQSPDGATSPKSQNSLLEELSKPKRPRSASVPNPTPNDEARSR